MGPQAAHASLGKGPDGRADVRTAEGTANIAGGFSTSWCESSHLRPHQAQREGVGQHPATAGGLEMIF